MLQKLFKYIFQFFIVLVVIVIFALIRNFEDTLFYDPFLNFFKGEYAQKSIPQVIEWRLYLNLLLRYLLNTFLSLFVIFIIFKNAEYVKLASLLYFVFLIILLPLFIFTIHFFSERPMLLFYIRRFIIQPMFLLLFIPGFYFQQVSVKK
jgi:exosortase F-associated protein